MICAEVCFVRITSSNQIRQQLIRYFKPTDMTSSINLFSMTSKTPQSPAVLTIAGSDCSGGAGIQVSPHRLILSDDSDFCRGIRQADLKTFCAYGCYGTSVITALTAQNTTGVEDVHPTPPAFIEKQVQSSSTFLSFQLIHIISVSATQVQMVLSDIDIKAIKTGMLYDTDNTLAVLRSIKNHYFPSPSSPSSSPNVKTIPPIICDPVCVSTSGHTLLHSSALSILTNDLFPLSTLITPNKLEAELLLSTRGFPMSINKLEDMISAANRMMLVFALNAVLVKGGHVVARMKDVERVIAATKEGDEKVRVVKHGLIEENMEILVVGAKGRDDVEFDFQDPELVVDVLKERGGDTTLFVRPRIESTSTHGTGCTLSAAIACALAQGNSRTFLFFASSYFE
jgi:hydroxymethylpyrimidine/phosphomethylpyrimidine kinase